MAEAHHFTMTVERDPFRDLRYRWAFSVRGELQNLSSASFATKREAQRDAETALKKRVALWHTTY